MKLLARVTALIVLIGLADFLPRTQAQAPRNDGPGPWDRDVIVYRASADGAVVKLATFDRAGVPTIARLIDKRLIVAHQHFPANDEANFDKVAVRFSADEGKTWTKPEVIRLTSLPDGMRFPFDPTLVPLPDGRVRLYFTSLRRGRFDQPAIYSAISQNGIDYVFESGVRFGIEGRPVIDCAVVLHQGVFHLFAPDNGLQLRPNEGPGREVADGRPRMSVGYHATSPDGLNFTRVADVQIDSRRRWLGNAQSDGQRIIFFGTGDPGPPVAGQPRAGLPRGSLWMATSSDGQKWQPVNSPVVSGGDPGAVATGSGGWIIVITGEPRPGTPSLCQNRPTSGKFGQGNPPPPVMPGSLAFDGSHLWVGEFKFSTRILRFSPPSTGQAAANRNLSQPATAIAQPDRVAQRPTRLALELSTRRDGTLDLGRLWSQGQAVGKGPVRFTHSPMRLTDIERIAPYGLMVGEHVCPIDHGYFYPKALQAGQEHFDVLAPADGFIVQIGHRTQLTGLTERGREYDDYALILEHSSTFYTQFDLLTKLDPVILQQLDESIRERFARKVMGPAANVRVPVKGGQVIGKVGGRSLDFGVVNTDVRLPGFLTPALYGHYAWRIHVVDPFDYFDEPVKSQLLKLNVRQAKPYFGKIDYDVDGKLVGNWFREGSGGYPGDRRDPRDTRGYWMGHLAFAYHHVDPSVVIVSIGDFGGRPRQFTVQGNGPDPGKVSAKDGIVKYDLTYAPFNSNGEPIQLPSQLRGVQGVLLVQLVQDRKLTIEAFPGKSAAEVQAFTSGATTYER